MSTEEEKKNLVFYIGNDNYYWKKIQGVLGDEDIPFEFKSFTTRTDNMMENLFLEIMNAQPSIIYIDLEINLQSQLCLSSMIMRDNSTNHIPIMGLIGSRAFIKGHVIHSFHFLHVKCGEFYAVGYNPCMIAFPDKIRTMQFAQANPNTEIIINADFKIGYITPKYIHCEGNVRFEQDQEISVDFGIPQKVIPSKKCIVRKIYEDNFYYDFKYAYDLEFVYLDKPVFDRHLLENNEENEDNDKNNENKLDTEKENEKKQQDKKQDKKEDKVEKKEDGKKTNEKDEEKEVENDEEEELTEEEKEKMKKEFKRQMELYELKLKDHKKRLKDWLLRNIGNNKMKKTKILIYDQYMKILKKEHKLLDTYPFVIRTQTCFSEDFNEIKKLRPNIICIQLFDLEESSTKAYIEKTDDESEDVDNIIEIKQNEKKEKESKEEKKSKKEEQEKDKKEEKSKDKKSKKNKDEEDVVLTEEEVKKKELYENEMRQLIKIIRTIKDTERYNPFLILFGCPFFSSKEFQNNFGYENSITNAKNFDLDSLLKMATLFEKANKEKEETLLNDKMEILKKKSPKKYRILRRQNIGNNTLYIEKFNKLSNLAYSCPIYVEQVDENQIILSSKLKLEEGNYDIKSPVVVSIRIIPLEEGKDQKKKKKEEEKYRYRGLIHSVGEEEKKILRQYINENIASNAEKKAESA